MTDDSKTESRSSDSGAGATVDRGYLYDHDYVCSGKGICFSEKETQFNKCTHAIARTEYPAPSSDIEPATTSTIFVAAGSDGTCSAKEASPAEQPETYPEGGLASWLVVLGAWLALFSSLGILNSLATFQTYVSTHQLVDESQDTIGWIFSLNAFICFFAGVYIGPIFDKYGPRWLVLAGTVCLVASLVLLSFCTSR
jgi:hypothetical protein